MSYSLIAGIVQLLKTDPVITPLLANGTDGLNSVHPQHFRDIGTQNRLFPLVTVVRFGDGLRPHIFEENEQFGQQMDNPKIAIDVWDENSIDNCYAAYQRIDYLLRGVSFPVTPIGKGAHFINYKIRRLMYRDDLFDETTNTYRLHSEYETWVYNNPVNPQPIG